ncbi:MAG: carbohydrate ABC transporter permease [Christensenellales bacterium]|jgi:putative aldouronate transport system permease protein
MIYSKSFSSRFANILIVLFFCIVSVLLLYPMLYVLFTSLSDSSQLIRHRGIIWRPLGFSTLSYEIVLSNHRISSGYRNTLFVLVVGLMFNLSLTSLGAYFLSRKNVFWFKPIMIMILITMYFSGGLIPFWLTVRSLGLYNSLWALILPSAISTYNMIVLRSYFQTIPDSLVESVFIDGAGHGTVLFRIFIPLSVPAMAVMVLYYGVGHWNSWFNAMIFLREASKYPLQLILRDMLILGTSLDIKNAGLEYQQIEEGVKAATIIVSTVPILLIYPFLQKYFVGGLMIGSLKG